MSLVRQNHNGAQRRLGGTATPEAVDEELVDVIKEGIARKGNGDDEAISRAQFDLIQELYERVSVHRQALPYYDRDWCDMECARRYLVARGWNLERAEEQLTDTLKWRNKEKPGAKQFWQATKAFKDPLALSMRIVGWDADGRPLGYTRFSEANDRWDPYSNLEHITLLMEASSNLIRKRRQHGFNQTADSRQCIWVVDFDGFSMRDQNPRGAYLTAALLQHYPEMLHLVVLIDAPFLFNGMWTLASPLLDDRVRRKFMFVKAKQAEILLRERLGNEAAEWLANETEDCADKKRQKGTIRRYWCPPEQEGEHDARGLPSYVNSEFYIKTPGDAYEETREGTRKSVATKRQENETKDHNPPSVQPSFIKTIYAGSF